jgi:hypothetical protein
MNFFNASLGYRSQGVDPSMYSDDPQEAQKMMDEDMNARWNKNKAQFQRDMLRQNATEGNQGRRQAPARAAQGQQNQNFAFAPQNPMHHPVAAAQGTHLQGMANATMGAFAQANAAAAQRAQQDRAYQAVQEQRNHEAAMAEAQRQHEAAFRQQEANARAQHNNMILGAAGLGHRWIRSSLLS